MKYFEEGSRGHAKLRLHLPIVAAVLLMSAGAALGSVSTLGWTWKDSGDAWKSYEIESRKSGLAHRLRLAMEFIDELGAVSSKPDDPLSSRACEALKHLAHHAQSKGCK